MNLLYFAPQQILPINSGGRLRNYQLANQLGARAEITFVQMRPSGEKPCDLPEDSNLESVVTLEKERAYTASKMLRGLAGPLPVTMLNCWSVKSASRLAEALGSRPFDTVQIEGVHLMEYLPVIRDAPGAPAIVVDWHNIESEAMRRYAETCGNWLKKAAALRTATLIEHAEDRLLDACATHTVTSKREREKLLARRPGANIQIVPNGVDTTFYSAAKIAEACRRGGRSGLRESKPAILFVGSMDYHPNIDAVIWFARTAWPEIARNHPELQFTIVGRDPAPEVCALASDRIQVTGTVDDVRPFYASAVAAVVPIRSGSGTRLKILEAMAAGVPVVSTRLGAEGIDAEDGVHLLLADSCAEIAAAVAGIASSEEVRFRLSRAARDLVCRNYDWSAIGEKLYEMHENLANARQADFAERILAP